jgi:Cys-tRNA synthase (O-phospho-L-seryl-tRNA:Cys-tRNA synthase)
MGGEEIRFVREAFDSNYIASLGPQVDAFEKELSEYVDTKGALALSSGTAAIHLALRILGVGPGDEVITSTLTFIGSVTPVIFQGANLVFVDCDRTSWNMDPDLLKEALEDCKRRGKMPKAVVPTDLYGQCADYGRIFEICEAYGVPLVVDAAEALGAKYQKSEVRSQKLVENRMKNPKSEIRNPKSGVMLEWEQRRRFFRLMGTRLLRLRAGGCWLRMIKNLLIMRASFPSRPENPFRIMSI